VLLLTAQLQYTAHNLCECFPYFLSPPLRIKLQLVVCNVCHTQTPFSHITTAALSVGRPCTYTHVRNKHQCCYLSIFTLLFLFWNEKKSGTLLSEQTSYLNEPSCRKLNEALCMNSFSIAANCSTDIFHCRVRHR
jgi:hypothetical protein